MMYTVTLTVNPRGRGRFKLHDPALDVELMNRSTRRASPSHHPWTDTRTTASHTHPPLSESGRILSSNEKSGK